MDSPYQKYFDTNYVPTVNEARAIHTLLKESAKDIYVIDTQITILQKQLDGLRDRREIINAVTEQHQGLVSPMRRLARDILEEIFLACLPAERNPCMSATEAPMLLTHICSSWRIIAHSTPQIWAKIHIPLHVLKPGSGTPEKSLVEKEALIRRYLMQSETIVNEWIARSSACPLSISIYQPFDWAYMTSWPNTSLHVDYVAICEELQEIHLSFIRNTLFPHHQRWRDLDLCVADYILQEFVDLAMKAESFQSTLETLHVTSQCHQPPRLHPPSDSDSDLDQPSLMQWNDIILLMSSRTTSATFNLHSVCCPDIASISLHVWENLTELNLKWGFDSFSSPDRVQFAIAILSQCRKLKILKLQLAMNSNNATLLPKDEIVLSDLTTLSIGIPCNPAGLAFAEALYLPSLTGLEFQCTSSHSGDSNNAGNQTVKAFMRASTSVHTLKLYMPFWLESTDDLIDLLKDIPSLRCLKIISKAMNNDRWSTNGYGAPPFFPLMTFHRFMNDQLLRALMSSKKLDSEIICPRLEEFECSKELLTDITEACLREFVVSRLGDERVSSLQRISLLIGELKHNDRSSNAEKLSLGKESAIYFVRQNQFFSPFLGFEQNSVTSPHDLIVASMPMLDSYNEL